MIADSLAGKRIAVTGSTGFLGTALVEKLLRSVPDCELVLLVRPTRRYSVERRVNREILRNDAFNLLRAQWGSEFEQRCEKRIQVVAGDVSQDGLGLSDADNETFTSCDVIIHSAATVSFDNPLDTSIEINLLGPNRIIEALHATNRTPHLVSVSTCYVAGNRRGDAREEFLAGTPFQVDVSWRGEVEAARRTRSDLDARSREPDRLSGFRKEAREELGAAGLPMLAAKTEQRRQIWVNDQMVEAGRSRATSLGWPDVYTYSKALGETALIELHGNVPVTVIRPSIIESAWSDPAPGWIRGFRMAEPLIVSFAKGELNTFPGFPEGILDVIPVDMVASAIIAAAANGPQPEPEVFQIASGSSNPLLFKVLLDTAMEWFGENPVYNADGHPTAGTEWKYAGSQGLEEQLKRVVKAFDVAGKVINRLPIRGEKSLTSKFAERRRNLAQIQGYVEIYGAYGKCEALYGIDKTLELWDSLSDQDRAEFGFDPRVIDWHHYITEVHLPTVMIQARVKTTPEKKVGPSRKDRLTEAVLNEKREFAAFDLENTLIASNVVASYAWMATRHLDQQQRLRFTLKTLAQSPGLWRRDKRDRTDFLRFFYQRYKGAPVAQLEEAAAEMLSNLILTKSFPAGLRRVRAHRAAGHKTILITGALDIAVEPLRPMFDHIVAAEIAQKDGLLTGEMAKVPPTGEVRAQLMLEWAAREGLDPSQGVAYADSASDLPMLEAVGYPVAVNPETRLVAIAEKRGWLTENWPKTPGAPNSILPMGPKAPRVTNQRGNN